MGKAKGKWLLALLALAFAAILAAVLCMNFPMAEVHAETAAAEVISATDEEQQAYEKLSDAFINAQDGDTIRILRDVSDAEDGAYLEGQAWLYARDKSLIVEGGGNTLTASSNRIALYFRNSTESDITLTIKDLTIVTTGAGVNPLLIYGEYIDLNLENVTLNSFDTDTSMTPALLFGFTCDSIDSVNIDVTI